MTHLYMTRLIHIQYNSFTSNTTRSYMTRRIHTWHDPFPCDMAHTCGSVARIHSWKYLHSHIYTLIFYVCTYFDTKSTWQHISRLSYYTYQKNMGAWIYIYARSHIPTFIFFHIYYIIIFMFKFLDFKAVTFQTPTLCHDTYQDYVYSGSHIQAPIFIFLYFKAVTFQTPTLCYDTYQDCACSGSHILTFKFFHVCCAHALYRHVCVSRDGCALSYAWHDSFYLTRLIPMYHDTYLC